MILGAFFNTFFELLFGKNEPSQSYKEYYSKDILRNYVLKNDMKNVKKIYDAGIYRADGKYLTKIKKVLDSERYQSICSLNKDRLYAVDESEDYEMPYGDIVSVYLIEFFDDRFQIIVEYWKAPKLSVFTGYDKYKKSVLFNKAITYSKLPIWCAEQIYPYK